MMPLLFVRSMVSMPSRIRGRRYTSAKLSDILRSVKEGKTQPDEAEKLIQQSSFAVATSSTTPEDTLQSFANLDHSRARRTGFPEVVYGEGKTPEQVATILDDMARHINDQIGEVGSVEKTILATRVSLDEYEKIAKIPLQHGSIEYHPTARIISMSASSRSALKVESESLTKRVVVATAGTTDLPVAEEAAVVLEAAGVRVDRVVDVGVAGLYRVLRALPRLSDPEVGCVIVVAGMDGALPSVVGGLVDVPVIAVPTSIGYGVSLGGISAMLTMLNSCAPGVGVVNIDNGFGAAALAFKFIRTTSKSGL